MLETELIKRCKNGDGNAFKHLIGIYKNKLFGYFWKFGGSKYAAEEMFQETLIKVWRAIDSYNNNNKFASWLFTIAHNVAVDFVRKDKSKLNVELDSIKNNTNGILQDDLFVRDETINEINSIVKILPDKQKRVFLLRQHGELTFKEIAEIINEPLNTVLSHMNYAIKKIKKELVIRNEL